MTPGVWCWLCQY